MRTSSRRLEVKDNQTCALLFGQHHVNLARLEQKLPVSVVARGNEVFVQGASDHDVGHAVEVIEALLEQLGQGVAIGQAEVDAALRMVLQADEQDRGERVELRTERKLIQPRSLNQAAYVKALQRHDLVFGLGPAGTGKTYLAVAAGVSLLRQRKVERLVLSRPAVEAGERLGFLPGDLKEKVDPYLRPLYDALQDMLPEGKLQSRVEVGQIEIAPLAFMRGRTLANSYVILDEAQNTTPMQMKMFLTRLGEGSRMVVTGDTTQIDLPPQQRSGLIDALETLSGIPEIAVTRFGRADVVRHPLVAKIVDAYDGVASAPGSGVAASGGAGTSAGNNGTHNQEALRGGS